MLDRQFRFLCEKDDSQRFFLLRLVGDLRTLSSTPLGQASPIKPQYSPICHGQSVGDATSPRTIRATGTRCLGPLPAQA